MFLFYFKLIGEILLMIEHEIERKEDKVVVSLTPGRAQDHQGKLPVSYRDDPG
jgi:hypothetical protein